MAECGGVKKDGSQCTASVAGPSRYCWAHDPANAGQRKKAAARAGRARRGSSLAIQAAGYRRRLEEIADRVLDPEDALGAKSAQAATGALNAALRSLTVQARLEEHEQLEPRLRAIEEAQKWAG